MGHPELWYLRVAKHDGMIKGKAQASSLRNGSTQILNDSAHQGRLGQQGRRASKGMESSNRTDGSGHGRPGHNVMAGFTSNEQLLGLRD